MTHDPRRVEQGQPLTISARDWNDTRDMLAEWRSSKKFGSGAQKFRSDSIRVYIRNDTGGDLSRFSILKITGVVFDYSDNEDEFLNRWTLKGDTPTSDTDRLVIIQSAVADGRVVEGIVLGVTPATVNVTDAGHNYAVVSDESEFDSATEGPIHILYKETGTGSKQALVLVGAGGTVMALIECAADEDFATTDASFDCIHGGALLGASSGSSTDTITVKNTAGIFEGSTGDAILALEVGGIYEMIQKEC